MVKITIPKHAIKGFVYYLKLSEEDKALFITELKKVPLGVRSSEVYDYFSNRSDALNSEDLVDLAVSFVGVDEETGLTLTELSKSMNQSLKDHVSAEELILGKISEKNIYLLLQAMNSDNFQITNKSHALSLDRSNLVEESKILVDVRPVFGGQDENEIKASVLLYNLRFSYLQNSTTRLSRNVYFSLDEEDLSLLKEQIIRAEKKAREIKKTYK